MFDASAVQEAQLANLSAMAAWALLVWETCLTLDDEVEHIWRMPNRFVKWLYYFIRYFGLASQTGCRIFIMWITYNNTATPLLCTVFRTTLAFTVQSLMTSMHLILMLRVFALYNRKRCIGVVLLSLLAGENITQVVSMVYTIPIITYNPTCHIQRIPRFAATHGFATISTQSIVLGLTIFKHVVALRAGWGRTPLVSLMIRDGALAFIVISAVQLSATMFIMFGIDTLSIHFVWWLLPILCASGCRLIVNMQRLATPQRPEPCELTTDFYDVQFSKDY